MSFDGSTYKVTMVSYKCKKCGHEHSGPLLGGCISENYSCGKCGNKLNIERKDANNP